MTIPLTTNNQEPTKGRKPDGTQYWYLNGVLHRVGGPAVIRPDGAQSWRVNGESHRTDGPAIIGNGTQWWLLNDVQLISR